MLEALGFILGTSLMYAAPLIFCALGGVLSENSGVIALGLEGMMTLGAFTAATVGYFTGNPCLAFIAAGMAGAILAALHAAASVSLGGNQVVSGIAVNFLGAGSALFLSRIFFEGATVTIPVSLDRKIPRPMNGFFIPNSFQELVFNQYATVYLALLLVLVTWYILYKTALGLRIRAVGENPGAADTLGVRVGLIRYLCVIASGLFSGFGGAALSIAVVSSFRPTLISGQGFIALAAVIFGRWKPQGALGACLIFGGAQALIVYLGDRNIPSQLLSMLPYVIALLVLTGLMGKNEAPAASGQPYRRNG